MVLLVIDTDVVVAAMRSATGASAALLRRALRGDVAIAASVAMVLEYEAVSTRPEHLLAARATRDEALMLIDAVAAVARPVQPHFRWRPQLRDADDEMMLEAAVNGRVDAIVTFNHRDFMPAAGRFGLDVLLPAEALRRIDDGDR